MIGTGDIINPVAMVTIITKMDMMKIMAGTIGVINRIGILTGIIKSGMEIIVAGTKNNTNAGIITVIDITIGRVIGSTIIIIMATITTRHMKEMLSDSN